MPSGTCSGGTPHIATTWLYAFDFSVIRFWEEIGWRSLLIAASMISRYFEEWFKGMNKAFVRCPMTRISSFHFPPSNWWHICQHSSLYFVCRVLLLSR
jgi:hypothetical protein